MVGSVFTTISMATPTTRNINIYERTDNVNETISIQPKISSGSYLWWPDLAKSVLFGLWPDLLDEGESVFPFFRRRFVDWTIRGRHKVVLIVRKT
jgi:hypothetical protein